MTIYEEHRIAAVINFCSNEYPFLAHCIQHLKTFSSQVIIPVCTHFFDGTPENQDYLRSIYSEHPDCLFLEFEFDPEKNRCGPKNSKFWPNLARMLGMSFVDKQIEYILFLDADEIVDDQAFIRWLNACIYRKYEVMQLACYWYFRKEYLQALIWEDTPLLVRKSSICVDMLMDPLERGAMYSRICGEKKRHLLGLEQKPMIHHYSWVRTKEQMLRKALSWSHRAEKDWRFLIEEEFSRPFNGKDFIHGYDLIEVPQFLELDLHKKPLFQLQKEQKNVRVLNTDAIHKIDLSLRFNYVF